MGAEMVKVKMASLAPSAGQGTTLRLSTTDGLDDIEFLLDDVAVALLVFTAGFVVKEIKARTDINPDSIHSWAKTQD